MYQPLQQIRVHEKINEKIIVFSKTKSDIFYGKICFRVSKPMIPGLDYGVRYNNRENKPKKKKQKNLVVFRQHYDNNIGSYYVIYGLNILISTVYDRDR